jgi:hypothetical protein
MADSVLYLTQEVVAGIWTDRRTAFLQMENVYEETAICVHVRVVGLDIVHNCTHAPILATYTRQASLQVRFPRADECSQFLPAKEEYMH